jgi:predicted DsbA family dithiol-disulfide isomerase
LAILLYFQEQIMSEALQIDIVSDIVCPWCYIGKRRLEQALALLQQEQPELAPPSLRWLPFQLNPDMPAQGMSRQDYLLRKFGHADGGDRYAHVKAEGLKEGLAFALERVQRMPNTLKAHALVAAAYATGHQAAVKEAMMRAFFMEGADLTHDAELLRIAQAAGLPAEAAHAVLQDNAALQIIAEQDAELRQLGIQGVPFFIINRQIGVSGAQPPQNLLAAMQQAMGSSVE